MSSMERRAICRGLDSVWRTKGQKIPTCANRRTGCRYLNLRRMVSDMAESCETCKFCRFQGESDGVSTYECRRMAPDAVNGFPYTEPNSWCGEWSPRVNSSRYSLRMATYAEPKVPDKRCETCSAYYFSGAYTSEGSCLLGDEKGVTQWQSVRRDAVCNAWERKRKDGER